MARWMNELEADTARNLLNAANIHHQFFHEIGKGYFVWTRISDETICFFLLREIRARLKEVCQ